MIAPSGHGLKPLDVELMKRLHDKVNLIPLIAKADTMTPEECIHFKKQVAHPSFPLIVHTHYGDMHLVVQNVVLILPGDDRNCSA